MENKALAIFGIGTYILSVLSSATDLEGNPTMPFILIVISGIATIVFIIMAVIRLWKEARGISIALLSLTIILFILSVIQGIVLPSYGSPIIILLNVAKVINFIVFFWAIIKLFKVKQI